MTLGRTTLIAIDSRNLRASIRRLNAALARPAEFYGLAARHMRDYVRQTITLSGRSRPFAPLSTWTKARTGRRKPLITLRPLIKAGWDNRSGFVYFDQRDPDWHIDMHHRGYTSPPVVNKRMAIPAHGGGLLAVITKRRAAKTPARKVWPTVAELEKEVKPIASMFLEREARKNWR